jgi:hypothetical protein
VFQQNKIAAAKIDTFKRNIFQELDNILASRFLNKVTLVHANLLKDLAACLLW